MNMSTISLGNVVNVSAGQPAPKSSEFAYKGHPFIRAGSLESLLNGASENSLEKISKNIAKQKRLKLFPKDTIVFAKSGMSAKLGRIYKLDHPAYIVSHLAALTPTGQYDPSYLTFWLRANPPSRLIKDDAYPSIRTSDISAMEVPLVNIDEQRRIVAILERANALQHKQKQALDLADEFLNSVFLDLFGDPVLNPNNFPEIALDEIADITSGLTKGRRVKDLKLRAVPYMRVANVQDGHLNLNEIKEIAATEVEIEKFRLKKDDLLLTEGGDPDKLGRGSVWRGEIEECIHQNHIFRVRMISEEIDPFILQLQIGSQRGKRYFLKSAKQTTGIASINKRQLSSYQVLIPEKKLQKKFLEIASKFQQTIVNIEKNFHSANHLIDSLSQRAFHGKL